MNDNEGKGKEAHNEAKEGGKYKLLIKIAVGE